MKTTKLHANYRPAAPSQMGPKGANCGTCQFMLANGQCQKVTGIVDPQHVCDYWKPTPGGAK